MKKIIAILLSAFLLSPVFASKKVVGYATPWGSELTEAQIASLTHLNLCFLRPTDSEGAIKCTYSSTRMKRAVEHAKKHGVKTLIAVADGDKTPLLSKVIPNASARAAFITNILDFIEKNSLDGIDNDWEPDFTQYHQKDITLTELQSDSIRYVNNKVMVEWYNPLNREFRDSLDGRFGAGVKILSAAIGMYDWTWYKHEPYASDNVVWPDEVAESLDFVNLMSYGSGGIDPVTNHFIHGNYDAVFGTTGSIDFWEKKGVPREKMVPGVPFYGMADWSSALYYKDIVKQFSDLTADRDTVTYKGKLYPFNGVNTIKERVRQADSAGTAGIMMWAADYDAPFSHELSLLSAISEAMSGDTDAAAIQSNLTSAAPFKLTLQGMRLTWSQPVEEIRIMSANGRIIEQYNHQVVSMTLPISLAKGIYFVHAVTSSKAELMSKIAIY